MLALSVVFGSLSESTVQRGSADSNAKKFTQKYFCRYFVHHNLMPSYWEMYYLNNNVHCTQMLFFLFVYIAKFSVSGSSKRYMTFDTETVLHFMAKCKGTDTNQLLPSIIKWQAFILLTQLGKKYLCDSKKSSDDSFNECRHTSSPTSTDLSSPLHGTCDEDVHRYF